MLLLLYLFLFIAVAGAAAVMPSVRVQLSVPTIVDRVDTLMITTTVTNDGDETIKLLKHPRSPLSDMPTDKFNISTQYYHVSPEFIGISAKYVSAIALASGDDSAVQVLRPQESIEVHHPIFEAYDFSTSGPGQYLITLKNLNTFYYVSGKRVYTMPGEVSQVAFALNIDGSLMTQFQARAVAQQVGENTKCTKPQSNAIRKAVSLAKDYVRVANEKLDSEGYDGAEYKRWFGAPSGERLSAVKSELQTLSGNKLSDIVYTCNTNFCDRPGVYAYVQFDRSKQVNICEAFFTAPVGGYNSRASTIVHEALHFKQSGDYTHGKESVEDLARNDPSLAVKNAESLEYFAAAVYGETGVPASQVYFGRKDADIL